ncbi:hypothetical protein [Kocuria massiliensis]|uniref:hypothetical protein n=1 Tax=Kocuria massiliensis TaxID=1926282 RepID=UPI000A1CCB19|nr:hypothetical protein [Kocuria massiliensis]
MPVITTLTKRDGLHWLCETMMIVAEELGYPEDAQAIREKAPWRRSQPIDRAPAGLPRIVKNLREKLKGRAYPDGDATAANAVIADVLGGSLDPLLWLRCIAPWHNHFVLQMIAARLWPSVVPAAGDVICQGLLVASVEGKHANPNCTVRDSILIQSEDGLCCRAIVDDSMMVVFGGDPVGPYVPWDTTRDYDPADSPTRDFAHAPGAAVDLLAAIQLFPGEDDQVATDLDRTVSSPVLGPEKAPTRVQPFAPLQAVLEQIQGDLPKHIRLDVARDQAEDMGIHTQQYPQGGETHYLEPQFYLTDTRRRRSLVIDALVQAPDWGEDFPNRYIGPAVRQGKRVKDDHNKAGYRIDPHGFTTLVDEADVLDACHRFINGETINIHAPDNVREQEVPA